MAEKSPLVVRPHVRAIVFFLCYQPSGTGRGLYHKGNSLVEALFDYVLVEALAACRRLCDHENDWLVAYRSVDLVASRDVGDVRAVAHAADVIEAYKDPAIVPVKYKSDGRVGDLEPDWPGGEVIPQRILDGVDRRFGWVFAHAIFGLDQIEELGTRLGAAPLTKEQRDRFTQPGAVLLELGETPQMGILRTPFQLSVCPTVTDRAE